MKRSSGRLGGLVDDPGGVGRPADRLGTEEGDVDGAERPRNLGIANEGGCELGAGCPTQEATLDDSRPEPQESRLIGQRLDPVSGDGSGEEVDRIRAEID